MGMYSRFMNQKGCEIKDDCVLEVCKNLDVLGMKDNEQYIIRYEKIPFNNWDGTKLQGYWYNETISALTFLQNKIRNITNKPEDNYAEFMYEEGTLFRICFYLSNGKPTWGVSFQDKPTFKAPEKIPRSRT